MLNCELCDYYRVLCNENESSEREIAMCGFTGVIFSCPVAELEMEYPCGNVSYGEYERRQKRIQSIHRFQNDDWRLIYVRSRLYR